MMQYSKEIEAAAANVTVVVAQTAGLVNQYDQSANDLIVDEMQDALKQAMFGSIGNVLGETIAGIGQFVNAGANLAKGTNTIQMSKELSALSSQTKGEVGLLQDQQGEAFNTLKAKDGIHLAEGGPDENLARDLREVPGLGDKADARAEMDYFGSKIETLNRGSSLEESIIKALYEGKNESLTAITYVGMGVGEISKALGSSMASIHKAIGETDNSMVQNGKAAYENANKMLSSLQESASTLYAGNAKV